MKKAVSVLGIIHDRSKIADGSLEECSSAISHTKESKASFSVVDILNPVKVLSLFKRMMDEVYFCNGFTEFQFLEYTNSYMNCRLLSYNFFPKT